jgi:Domain of unknown function (DUF4337)
MSAHATLEHAEHAAHGGGHEQGHEGGSSNKIFGITMALIGVLIALCSAMVGSERNELTKTMIKQTQSHADYTAASTKFRLIMLELEKQRARISAQRDPAGGFSPVERFIELSQDYSQERNLSKRWADSYEPVVEAHFEAAERFEHAQVVAEIGIVMASLAVLLASRPPWFMSVLLSGICVVMLSRTYFHTSHIVDAEMVKVGQAEKAYEDLRKAHGGADEDQKTIERLDADGGYRRAIAERRKNLEGGAIERTAENKPKH